MLEQKLIIGRYITLATPPQVTNGPAVGGIQPMQHTMLHIDESTMSFRGPKGFGAKTSTVTVGHVAKAWRNYQWLEWRQGFVSEVPQNGIDVLTGPMSGCWITRYTRGGATRVGHVGTANNPGDPDTVAAKNAWNNAVAGGVVAGETGFNPFNDWPGPYPAMNHGTDGAAKVFALVTSAGAFFSVFTYPLLNAPTTIRIAGIQAIGNTLPAPI